MSDFIKPCYYKGNSLNNQWMNTIFNSHDLFCGCLDPITHLKKIIKQQECPRTKDVAVGTTTKITTEEDAIDAAIGGGDLEELFKEEDTQG